MQARLKVLHDKANVKQVKLLPVTLIGRSTDCNLKIASSQVSRNHCRITLGVDSVFVEDLGSANGTLVDGQLLPAHQPTAIAPGAHLVVGPAEFQIDYVASTSATLVLSRSASPPPTEPSTEMIYPAATQVAPPKPTPESVPAAPVVEVAVPLAVPVATPVAAVPEPQPVTASEFVPVQNEPPVEAGGTEFGFADDQADTFQFTEPAPDVSVPSESAGEPKKGRLKSLFSLFGRKERQDSPASPANPATPQAVSEPGVFLPTMDAQFPAAISDTTTVTFTVESGPESAGAAESAETTEVTGDQPVQGSGQDDDALKQFLSQF